MSASPQDSSSDFLFLQELIGEMLRVNVEARYTAQDILSHPWVTVPLPLRFWPHTCVTARTAPAHPLLPVRLQEDVVFENNIKTEVTGKLKTHFNTEPKPSDTTAGVSVIMVSTENISKHHCGLMFGDLIE